MDLMWLHWEVESAKRPSDPGLMRGLHLNGIGLS